MQTLRQYITDLGINQAAAAADLGVSKGYLSLILSGKKIPGREMIQRIATYSGGKVSPAVWFPATNTTPNQESPHDQSQSNASSDAA